MSAWDTLGVAHDADEATVRRAYADQVRRFRPDSHPQEFARVREAYETVLQLLRGGARRAAAEPAAPEVDAGPAPSSSAPSAATPSTPAPSHAGPPTGPPVQPQRPYAAAEARIAELAKCHAEAGEGAAARLLHAQFEAVSHETVDERIEWEVVFLHSLLHADLPPLALLFEGNRLLQWERRANDVHQMVGEGGAQQLQRLLAIANESTYARFFSPNRWHGCLFGRRPPAWFGMASQVAVARQFVRFWKDQSEATGRAALMRQLEPRTLRRIEDLSLLLSTDIVFALLGAWIAWGKAEAPVGGSHGLPPLAQAVLAFALLVPAPLLGRWLWRTPVVRRLRSSPRLNKLSLLGAVLACALAAFVGGLMVTLDGAPAGERFAGGAILIAVAAVLMVATATGIWMCARGLEQLVALPWLWLQRAWGGHAFASMLQGRDAPGWREQLRHVPAAAGATWTSFRALRKRRKLQEREAKARGASPRRGFPWWWIWVAVGLLQVISHLGSR